MRGSEKMKKSNIVLTIIIMVLLAIICYIVNMDYVFCFNGQDNNLICSHQKIGDYILGKN